MRSTAVASGNARSGRARRGVPFLCLLLGALGCGADASGVAQSSGALEPEPWTAAEASRDSGGSAPEAAGEETAPAASGPAADPASDADGASLAHSIPLTEPPPPAPPPSAELETARPVDSTEPVDVLVPPGECRFEYLGKWVRCEGAGWPNAVEADASDLLSCMQQCLDRDDCTGVTDYLWLGRPELGCFLYVSTCDAPAFVAWGEEDGGRDFRRACD